MKEDVTMSKVELKVNGLDYKVDVGLNTTLLEILRDRLVPIF